MLFSSLPRFPSEVIQVIYLSKWLKIELRYIQVDLILDLEQGFWAGMSRFLHDSWTGSPPNTVGVWISSANMDYALFAVSVYSAAKDINGLFGTCDISPEQSSVTSCSYVGLCSYLSYVASVAKTIPNTVNGKAGRPLRWSLPRLWPCITEEVNVSSGAQFNSAQLQCLKPNQTGTRHSLWDQRRPRHSMWGERRWGRNSV